MRRTYCLLMCILLIGCSNGGEAESGADSGTEVERVSVVAAMFPQYDFARAVAGDKADLKLLIQPGMSVHSYDPTPADIKALAAAEVIIYGGGESDSWVERVTQGAGAKKLRLMDYVDTLHPDHSHEGDGPDEHVWTSPKNAAIMVDAIANCLAEADVDNAEYYSQNAKAYSDQIMQLDAELESIVGNAARKTIVVADKFPFLYLTTRYGLAYHAAFNACEDQGDPDAATIARLINTVKSQGIPVVYYVELSTENVARSISEQTGAQAMLLHSCQNLSAAQFAQGATYLSLMRDNALNLKAGLN